MSIMDIFTNARNANAPAPQQQQQQQQNQPGAPADPNQPQPGGEMQRQQQSGQDKQPPKNPLDEFANLWNNSNNEGSSAPEFNLDPTKIKTLADTLDFSSAVPADFMQKLQAGDQTAIPAMLNTAMRQLYTLMMQHNAAVTGKFVDARSKYDLAGMDRTVRSILSKNSLDSVAANNPIAKKHMDLIAEQLTAQHPNATPEWIKQKTVEYFTEMAKLVAPQGSQQSTPATQDGEVDWASWLNASAPKKQ